MGTKLLDSIKGFFSNLWSEHKLLLIAIVVVIVAIKFNNILIALLTMSAERLYNVTKTKTSKLETKENAENAEADKLVADAKKLGQADITAGDDWNEK